MLPIQFILFAVVAGIYARTLANASRKKIMPRSFFLWTVFWSGTCLIILFPDGIDRVAKWVGLHRGADMILYLGMVLLFFLIFRILVQLEKLERNITRIVRGNALKK